MKNMRQVSLGVLASLLCASAMAAGPSVLVLGSDYDTTITTGLTNTGQLGSITYYNAMSQTPTLAYLQGYSAVLAFTNFTPANPSGLGDILKQYVDGGGGLVMNTYAYSPPWSITGGITNTGYAPLVSSGMNGNVSGNLVQVAPHPIFNGVNLAALTYFNNVNFAHPTVDAGAMLLATDGAGVNMIAINANGRVISNNTFPNYDGNNAQYYKLTANELLHVGGMVTAVPEPETYAMLLAGLGAVGFVAKRKAKPKEKDKAEADAEAETTA